MGGLFITAPHPPPVGTKLRLAFEIPGGNVRANAIVRNIAPAEGFGVGFTRMGHRRQALAAKVNGKIAASMKNMKATACLASVLILMGHQALWARLDGPTSLEKSGQSFVKSFYDWYPARAFTTSRGWLKSSLRDRPSCFAPELLSTFKEFQKATPNSQAEIDNLDFDPFLNAQDTADSYEVENFTRKRDTLFAEVYSVSSGKKNKGPDVVPELIFRNGNRLFINFHYPNSTHARNENLQNILKSLLETRADERR